MKKLSDKIFWCQSFSAMKKVKIYVNEYVNMNEYEYVRVNGNSWSVFKNPYTQK